MIFLYKNVFAFSRFQEYISVINLSTVFCVTLTGIPGFIPPDEYSADDCRHDFALVNCVSSDDCGRGLPAPRGETSHCILRI
jgi:hypothetical protein